MRLKQYFLKLPFKIYLLLLLLSTAVSVQAEVSYNHSATLSSDYFIRGLSRSLYDPSLRYGGELQTGSFIAGFNLVSADYPGVGPFADDSADFEYAAYVGYFGELTHSISWQSQIAYHEYVGGGDGFNGDYFEGSFSLHFPLNLGLTYLVTKNEHMTSDYAHYIELSTFRPLNRYLVASGTLGIARTDSILGSNYEYLDFGLSVLVNSFSLDFRQYISTGSAGRLQPLADDHFVVSLTKSF